MAVLKQTPQCTSCKNRHLEIKELSHIECVWIQDDAGNLTFSGRKLGDVLKVSAVCRICGRKWTLRGITEADNLPNWKQRINISEGKKSNPETEKVVT